MKQRPVALFCLTILIAAGLKYVPSYLIEQQRLDLQERALDLKEEAFLRQRAAPTVMLPAPSQPRDSQLL